MKKIPQLNECIEVTIFHSSPSELEKYGTRYLVQLEHVNLVISQGIKNIIDALLLKPESLEELSNYYYQFSEKHTSGDKLLALIEDYIPDSMMKGEELPPIKTPFILSKIILPTALVEVLCAKITWLFKPKVVVSVLSAFILMHAFTLPYFFNSTNLGWQNVNVFLFISIMTFSFLWHELGHASACKYYNCKHGGIGFGLYFIFPVFYADVTSAWKLKKKQRAVIDVGGLYFQCLMLVFVDLFAWIYNDPLSYKLSWTITFTMLYTLNPFFKFDGYWLLSDLSGETNLHSKMRHTMATIFKAIVTLRKPDVSVKKDNALLFTYTFLSLIFFGYCFNFIISEIQFIINTLPTEIHQWNTKYRQLTWMRLGIFIEIFELIKILTWPIILSIITLFFTKKICRMFFVTTPKKSLNDRLKTRSNNDIL